MTDETDDPRGTVLSDPSGLLGSTATRHRMTFRVLVLTKQGWEPMTDPYNCHEWVDHAIARANMIVRQREAIGQDVSISILRAPVSLN